MDSPDHRPVRRARRVLAVVVRHVEDAINSAFEPVSTAVQNVIFYAPTIVGSRSRSSSSGWSWRPPSSRSTSAASSSPGSGRRWTSCGASTRGPATPGEVTHFQALSSAVSGTVGLGNIAGVGVAVTIGGAGATFWMIVAGLLGMCTKFVECTLGVKYREVHEDGSVTGGAFRYLPIAFERFGTAASKVLTPSSPRPCSSSGRRRQHVPGQPDLRPGARGHRRRRRLPRLGRAALVFGSSSPCVGLVILGGISSIARVTSRLVPAMALLYLPACFLVIAGNVANIPEASARSSPAPSTPRRRRRRRSAY